MRIALGVEYDGHRYSGWQSQVGSATVQDVVESALAIVANHPLRVSCAGRTDAGVHAREQVIHFDTDSLRQRRQWVLGSNVNLPRDIAIRWAHPVDTSFHARFCAYQRSYRYVINNRPVRPALRHASASWIHASLDAERMHEAAQALVGEHDFDSYRTVACQAKSPVRTINKLSIVRQGEYLMMDVTANAFLHHMVRNIAGVLIAIGSGEKPVGWAQEVLDQRSRVKGGVTAPPTGLFFMRVDYPPEFMLPQQSLVQDVLP